MWPTYSTFLASSQLTTNIHWSCYCTLLIYVVLHFCDIMWSIWFDTNLCRFFKLFVYICDAIGDQILQIGTVQVQLTSLILPHECVCPTSEPISPTSIRRGLPLLYSMIWIRLFRIMSIPFMFRLFRIMTSEMLERLLPVFTLLLRQRQHMILVDAVDYK